MPWNFQTGQLLRISISAKNHIVLVFQRSPFIHMIRRATWKQLSVMRIRLIAYLLHLELFVVSYCCWWHYRITSIVRIHPFWMVRWVQGAKSIYFAVGFKFQNLKKTSIMEIHSILANFELYLINWVLLHYFTHVPDEWNSNHALYFMRLWEPAEHLQFFSFVFYVISSRTIIHTRAGSEIGLVPHLKKYIQLQSVCHW